jgi:predicted nuclease of predicted toxin-antitoxin system
MHFLADESCDFAMVRALRVAEHEVLAVADIAPRTLDPNVIDLAVADNRILLTEDKDFGQLVYSNGAPSAGVILLRYAFKARLHIAKTRVELVKQRGDQLAGAFVVVQPGRVRIRPGGPPPSPGITETQGVGEAAEEC